MRLVCKIIIILLVGLIFAQSKILSQNEQQKVSKKDFEVFPILNYDTDVGFGYGVKGFFFNYLNKGESIDLTAFNSTKGERWYRFVYSIPDIQRRHGTKYNFALDFIVDYDKWINYEYYWDSNDELYYYNFLNINHDLEKEKYIREPIELKVIFSRAFTSDFVAELGAAFKNISCYKFRADGILKNSLPKHVQHFSVVFNFRLDTRSDIINPHKGLILEIDNEYGINLIGLGKNYFCIGFLFQGYLQIINSKIVLATRLKLQAITDVSYQNLLSIGGNNSVRGLPQDRYLSNSLLIFNEELRFPLWWRFSGVIGVDAGNSPLTPYWIVNPVFGLRFNMDNFVVRADLGVGKESTGFYVNFGQLF